MVTKSVSLASVLAECPPEETVLVRLVAAVASFCDPENHFLLRASSRTCAEIHQDHRLSVAVGLHPKKATRQAMVVGFGEVGPNYTVDPKLHPKQAHAPRRGPRRKTGDPPLPREVPRGPARYILIIKYKPLVSD